jgi:hypothetical protein
MLRPNAILRPYLRLPPRLVFFFAPLLYSQRTHLPAAMLVPIMAGGIMGHCPLYVHVNFNHSNSYIVFEYISTSESMRGHTLSALARWLREKMPRISGYGGRCSHCGAIDQANGPDFSHCFRRMFY